MWHWIWVLVAGLFLAPVASEALESVGVGPERYRAMGEIRIPEKIHSKWGKKLNPSGAVPNRGFKAIYFDRSAPGKVVFQENVESIAIKYAWADFHRIDSPRFGGYWVGKLNFDAPATKQISVSQSWSKSRILINGQIVFDGGDSGATFTHRFAPGEHVVEVEFINNWHTTEYKVTIEDERVKLEPEQIAAHLSRAGKPSALYYAGLYESSAKDTSVSVTLPPSRKRAVLWLTSYEAIDWHVRSSGPVTVIVSSYAPGSRVRGSGVTEVAHVDRSMSISRVSETCSCSAGHFHCEQNEDLAQVAEELRSVTGLALTGYAVRYSAAQLAMQPYGKTIAARILDRRSKREAERKICEAKANPDFDKLMN